MAVPRAKSAVISSTARRWAAVGAKGRAAKNRARERFFMGGVDSARRLARSCKSPTVKRKNSSKTIRRLAASKASMEGGLWIIW